GPRAFDAAQTTLAPGESLWVFSDGAFEVVDASGRERSLADFEALLASTPERRPAMIHGAVCEVAGLTHLADDFSLLALTPTTPA
ncbi:MAG: SpoIIE family protein phosphatase, partial [Planctomycetota bacterium]